MSIAAYTRFNFNLLSFVKHISPDYRYLCSTSKPNNNNNNQNNELLVSSTVTETSSTSITELDKQGFLRKLDVHDALKCVVNDKLSIQGWVRSLRSLKNHYFFSICDGLSTKKIQAVVPKDLVDAQGFKPSFGASVICQGTIVESKGSEQDIELYVEKIKILGSCDALKFPFNTATGKTDNWNGMREHYHLRPRVNRFGTLLRFRSDLNYQIHNIMKENNYIHVTTPILTKNDCEGGSKPFVVRPADFPDDVSFFKGKTKLTVSAQLHLETAACALSRVYTIGPTFRAEMTKSRRHLSEFTMFEVEEAFINDLDVLMDRAEFIMKSLAEKFIAEPDDNLSDLWKSSKYDLAYRLTGKYLRLTYEDAIELLNQKQKIQPAHYGQDLSAYHETFLLNYFENQPLFITHFPIAIKPFYMKSDADKALCFDLLVPVAGEVCGGSLREDNLEKLEARMSEVEGMTDELDWYIDLRRFGNVPHGGFGFGFDRMVQTMTGLNNIKDVVPYPRFLYHCDL